MVYVAAIPRCRAERFLVVEVVDQPPCHEAPEPFDQVLDATVVLDMPFDDTVDDAPVVIAEVLIDIAPRAVRARTTGRAVGCVRWEWSRWCMSDRWWVEPDGIDLPLGKQTAHRRRN